MKNDFLEKYFNRVGISFTDEILLEGKYLVSEDDALKLVSQISENEREKVVKQAIAIVEKMQGIAKQIKSKNELKRLKLEPYKASKPESNKPTEKETPKEEQEEQAWNLNRYFARS